MISGFWGKKIGMTQVFSASHKVVPVTVIDFSRWVVTQVKTQTQDGYYAVQLGCVKDRFNVADFSPEWLTQASKYFVAQKEVRLKSEVADTMHLGQTVKAADIVQSGDFVDVVGTTIGRGFQGGVKRYGFKGGRGSHGDKLGRGPGSLSHMRSQGRVIKGKRLPGHMGVDRCMIKKLEIVQIEPQGQIVLVKGSVPGKSGSFVFLKKCEGNI